MLKSLEDAAEKLNVTVRYDDLKKGVVNTAGGSCILKGDHYVLVHKHLSDSEKADLLADALSEMEIDSIYLAPEIRQLLERIREKTRQNEENNALSN